MKNYQSCIKNEKKSVLSVPTAGQYCNIYILSLYARQALERVGLQNSEKYQKGRIQGFFSIKGALIKRVGLK